jgi:2-polyprenyl-3-methyl-5-hydroxy-6-metoxy-1,4-benzoquinol methylase
VACGEGCHAIAAAARGARVVGVDRDADSLKAAEKAARKTRVNVEWVQADLTRDPFPNGPYDIVMVFSYLDRRRTPELLALVKPGGYLLMETFLDQQRSLGWGPTSDDHLLKTGELWHFAEPFEVVLAREVLEILDGRSRVVGSLLAQRPME